MPLADRSVNVVFMGEGPHKRPTFQTVFVNGRKYGSNQNNRRVGTENLFICASSLTTSAAWRMQVAMLAQLAQVCLFSHDAAVLRRFCDVVSGELEGDNGRLRSCNMGAASVAHHPPAGELAEGDVWVTLQVAEPAQVDTLHREQAAARIPLDDHPEDTKWGWRSVYCRVAPHLVFEVGAPRP